MAQGPYTNEGLMQEEAGQPNILGLGDSWFWYPANNLLIPIWNLWGGTKVILTHGFPGAKAVQLTAKKVLDPFRSALRGYDRLEAVLLSAGGNDFAGRDDMLRILKSDCSGAAAPEDCFDHDSVEEVLFGEVLGAYRTLVGSVKDLRPEVMVFVHNYDYAIPTGLGFGAAGDFKGFGGWLKLPMDMVGVPAALQPAAVNHLIDKFSEVLVQVQKEFPSQVLLVDTTGTLSAGDWANELHPTPKGFEKLVHAGWEPLLT